MDILNLLSQPTATGLIVFLATALSLVLAISIHEFCHAWAADLLGDPNPRLQGRLTLNPLRHLDPIGTIMLIFFNFGWGKPVQFDPYNLKNPHRDSALIAGAGPASNLLLALLGALFLFLLSHFTPGATTSWALASLFLFLYSFITINITLAIFNLLPIPPLDGSHIIAGLLPPQTALSFKRATSRLGPFLLILCILPLFGGLSLISLIIGPISSAITSWLIPY